MPAAMASGSWATQNPAPTVSISSHEVRFSAFMASAKVLAPGASGAPKVKTPCALGSKPVMMLA